MITHNTTKTVTVKIASVFTYADNDFKNAKGEAVTRVIDLAELPKGVDAAALVTRALLYGWGRSLNDAKGSSAELTEAERRDNQSTRLVNILNNTWAQGGGGGAKADPVFVEVRAIIVVKTKKTLGKVTKRFKSLGDVRKAYGDTVTDMWVASAEKTIKNRATLGDADDDLPDAF